MSVLSVAIARNAYLTSLTRIDSMSSKVRSVATDGISHRYGDYCEGIVFSRRSEQRSS